MGAFDTLSDNDYRVIRQNSKQQLSAKKQFVWVCAVYTNYAADRIRIDTLLDSKEKADAWYDQNKNHAKKPMRMEVK
jgi:hypothetical protein